jgi:SAM-dependent methyltransferase
VNGFTRDLNAAARRCHRRVSGRNRPHVFLERGFVTDNSAYDRVPYLSRAMPQTHPSRLATIAALFGLSPAPIDGADVLELGCGDGGNLIPMALGLPRSRLVGIDLSEGAIRRGRALIDDLGVKTVALHRRDLRDRAADLGTFDYIICHGVFSWVPPDVQKRILDLIRARLRPQGVALVSYNTYPGGYLRRPVNELMQWHARGLEDPEERIRQAMAILEFASEGVPDGAGAYGALLKEERERLRTVDSPAALSNHLIHDRLSEDVWTFYFHEFMEQCDARGLTYLGEADFFEMHDHYFPERIRTVLAKVSGGSLRAREQMLDFLKGRKFRQTLLCHEGLPLNRQIDPRQIMDGFVASRSVPLNEAGERLAEDPAELLDRDNLSFGIPGGSCLTTDHPAVRRAFLQLGRNWPMPVPFDELMAAASDGTTAAAEDRLAVADSLLSAYAGNLAEFYVELPRFARSPGRRPVASPLARRQIRDGARVTTLIHRTVDVANTCAPWFLPLLDGTLDRDEVTVKGRKALRSANAMRDGDDGVLAQTDGEMEAAIHAELMELVRFGLLMPESES